MPLSIENLPTSIHAAQSDVAVDLAVNTELYMDDSVETPRVADVLNILPHRDEGYPVWVWKPERYAVAGAIGLIGLDPLVVGDGPGARLAYMDSGDKNENDPYKTLYNDLGVTLERATSEMEHGPRRREVNWLYWRYDQIARRDPSLCATRGRMWSNRVIDGSEAPNELSDMLMGFGVLFAKNPLLAERSEEELLTVASGLIGALPLHRATKTVREFRSRSAEDINYDKIKLNHTIGSNGCPRFSIDFGGELDTTAVEDPDVRVMCTVLNVKRPGDRHSILWNLTMGVLHEGFRRGLLNPKLALSVWEERKAARPAKVANA